MNREPSQGLRVEQALRLLPEGEALAPLRGLLVATSHPDEESVWASSGPYRTVGKRRLQSQELRRRLPQLVRRVGDHVSALYDAVVEALELEGRGERVGAVRALLKGGEREESVGRYTQASAWYELALGLSEELHDRRPEIEALSSLGRLSTHLGRYEEGGRYYQRAFALAEAEFDPAATVLASQGLGEIALAQGALVGAESWFTRGLSLAEASSDERRVARLHSELSDVARRRGDLEAAAERLLRAREILEPLEDRRELARVWNSEGQVETERGRHEEALAAYRKALAALRRTEGDPSLQAWIRVNLAELYLQMDRFLEAEDEIRRAEETAIAHNLTRRLIRIYAVMGKLSGRQEDETGFVFFEKALELCRAAGQWPLLEAEVYYEYGAFRAQMGEPEEARAHLEHACQILESLGDLPELDRVRAELERLGRGDGSGAATERRRSAPDEGDGGRR